MALIIGTPADEILTGGGADDEIHGLEGHDYLRGRLGNDVLFGGLDDDFMNGSFGDDQFFGGDGYDRVSLYDHTFTITSGCTVSLATAGVPQDTGQGFDIFGRDIEHVSGTYFDDRLTGNDENNWLWGQNYDNSSGSSVLVANADRLNGRDGDDLLECGLGDNILIGGAGTGDTASIRHTTGALDVSLLLHGAVQNTLQGMMLLKGIENLSGGDFTDRFIGDNRNNALFGNGGGDILLGNKGTDRLYGDGFMDVDTHGLGYSGPITQHDSGATGLDGFANSGEDFLDGGRDRDVLVGGGFADFLTGGPGDDTFLYLDFTDSLANSPNGDFEDQIKDLQNNDVIDLIAVDADLAAGGDQNFTMVAAFTGVAGEMMLTYDAGLNTTYLMMNINADFVADMIIDIAGNHLGFANIVG
jgi:Ca2+-binding RTX toxin-like protein